MSLLKVQNQLDSLQAQVDALYEIEDLAVRSTADGSEYVVVNVAGDDYKMLSSTFFRTPSSEQGLNFNLGLQHKNSSILITANSVTMTIPTSLGWAKGDQCLIELGGTGFAISSAGVTVNSPTTLSATQNSFYLVMKTDTDEFTIAELGAATGGSGDMTKAVYDPNTVEGDAFDMDNMSTGITNLIRTSATDAANRDRANHTGTQTASTISDFDTEVSNNTTVVANSAAVNNQINLLQTIDVMCSDMDSDLTTGTSKAWWFPKRDGTVLSVYSGCSTAPTGSVVTNDINKNGTTILSTKLTIDAGENTSLTAATAAVISVSSFSAGDIFTFDTDTIGSTVAGKGNIVSLDIKYTS